MRVISRTREGRGSTQGYAHLIKQNTQPRHLVDFWEPSKVRLALSRTVQIGEISRDQAFAHTALPVA